MATRKCRNSPDSFCYVCGYYVSSKGVSRHIEKGTKYWMAYRLYFGMPIGDQDKAWAPHVICGSCQVTLEGWLRGSRKSMPFAIARVWREPKNHLDDCYFCSVDITKYRKAKGRLALNYPSMPSSIAPVPHSHDLPVPLPPAQGVEEESADSQSEGTEDNDPDYEGESSRHFPTQKDLDDLIRDLRLSKSGAELLTSRLREWNILGDDCKVTVQRTRHIEFSVYYQVVDSLCFCHDIQGLFEAIGIKHDPTEWRLFIDSSTKSLKAVLLHNGNVHPSIPVGHSTQMKEDYNNVKQLMEQIKYTTYTWDVCGDFKMLGFLLGLQAGYTKYSCFLCLWDSRAKSEHYHRIQWPTRDLLELGHHNVSNKALVPRSKVLLPPLHIKLGLIKQFVTALDCGGTTYQEIRLMFPKLSEAKVKGGIFIGPQVRTMLASEALENTMGPLEKRAWRAFRDVVNGFLGNVRAPNYQELVANMISAFHAMGCRMSLKVHYLHSHLDFFRDNLGHVSEEHGERFHQDILVMEQRYKGHWDSAMMGDYVWSLVRRSQAGHKRKARSSLHF